MTTTSGRLQRAIVVVVAVLACSGWAPARTGLARVAQVDVVHTAAAATGPAAQQTAAPFPTSGQPATVPTAPVPGSAGTPELAGRLPRPPSGAPSASPSGSPSEPAVVGPLPGEPTPRPLGLPTALAALGVVGVGSLLVRVLLAEPAAARVPGRPAR